MRNPIRSEAEAFSFVLVMCAVFGAVALAGWLGNGWTALAVFLALGLGAWVGIYMKSEPKERPLAVWERRPHPGARRILVVANETVAGRALRNEILHRTRGHEADVLVVCPALNSPLKHWTSDDDGARAAAHERLFRAGILVRAGAGVGFPGHLRVSVGLRATNEKLLALL